MKAGQLIAVVGPSGVGKDSVIDGIVAAVPGMQRVKRVITRAPELGGEDFDPATPECFERGVEAGRFCIHWRAHGLRYGIPVSALESAQNGAQIVGNLSRGQLGHAHAVFPRLNVLLITASPQVLADRLAARGRETEADVARRLARVVDPLPSHLDVTEISNDGRLEDTIAQALRALDMEKVT